VGIFCCWPLGLIALIFAIQANSHYSAGKQREGQSSANVAKGLGITAIVCGVSSVVLIFAVTFLPFIILPAAAASTG
jgi:hypothetical protein